MKNKYRACKTIQEFYELVTGFEPIGYNNQFEDFMPLPYEECMKALLGKVIHWRGKGLSTSYYGVITQIDENIHRKGQLDENGVMRGELWFTLGNYGYQCFKHLFKDCEIDVDGEWVPFGVKVK